MSGRGDENCEMWIQFCPQPLSASSEGKKMERKIYCSRGKGIGSKYCYLKKIKKWQQFLLQFAAVFFCQNKHGCVVSHHFSSLSLSEEKEQFSLYWWVESSFSEAKRGGKCPQLFPWMLVSILFCYWKVDGQYYFSWRAMLSPIC